MSGPSQPGAALVMRPSLPRYLGTVKATMLLSGVLLVALLLRGGAFGAITSVTVIAVASCVIPIYFRRAAITVTQAEIVATGLIRTRRTPRAEVGSIVTAALPRTHKASRTHAHLFVLDRDGHRVARMKGSHWFEDDMRLLIRQLGIAPTKLGRVESARRLARSYPRAVPVLERYPVLAGALVVVPALAIILALSVELS